MSGETCQIISGASYFSRNEREDKLIMSGETARFLYFYGDRHDYVFVRFSAYGHVYFWLKKN